MLGTKIKTMRRVHSDSPVELYRRGEKDKNPYVYAEGDYAGFQLRIIAMYSGDKNMIHAFRDLGGDLHSMTAVAAFHPFNDITLEEFMQHKKEQPYKHERKAAKGINFGICFGMSAFTYASRLKLDWTPEEARKYSTDLKLRPILDKNGRPDYFLTSATQMRASYFKAYPSVAEWHKRQNDLGRRDGYIRSPFGCVRMVPQLTYVGSDDSDRNSRYNKSRLLSNLENVTKNSYVQTHEATIIMRSMRRFLEWAEENRRPEDRPVICGTIHDAVSYYIKMNDLEAVQKLHEFFEDDYPENLGVPLSYEFEYAVPRDESNPTYWGFGYEEGEGPMFENKNKEEER